MQYVVLSIAYLFVFFLLMPPKDSSGAAIYKGELGDDYLKPMRYFVYGCFYILAFFGSLLKYQKIPFWELLFQVAFIALVEGTIYFRRSRQARVERRARVSERVSQPGQVIILTASELEAVERERLADIVRSGSIDDILELCSQNIEAGMGSRSFSIPRWLTRDEYNAMHSTMKEKEWLAEYSVFAQFTGRPRLVISRINPRPQMREPDRQ